MVFITNLLAVRLFSFVIFVLYDIFCFAYERSSITNCSQKVLVSNPLPLVHLWLAISNLTSISILIWLYKRPMCTKFCGFKSCLTKLLKKGAFWSLNTIFGIILIDYVVRCIHEGGSVKIAYAVCIAFNKLLCLLVLWSLNYVHPIVWPCRPRSLQGAFIFVTYWLGLVFYFVENFYLFISNSLDMGENIYPLGSSSSDKDRLFLVMLSLVIGAKVTFHIRLIEFFWHKIFHGNKDLMSDAAALETIPDY